MLASTTSSDSTLLSPSSSSSNSSASSILNNNDNDNNNNNNNDNNPTAPAHKTMEEVWKDITISSLPNTPISHIHTVHHPTPSSQFKGFIFQDFFNGGPESRRNPSIRPSTDSPPPSQTKLTSQTQEFQFFDNELMNSQTHNFQIQGNSSVPSLIDGVAAFNVLASSSVLATFGGGCGGSGGGTHNKKRFCEGDEEGSVDRRHKRMIKNRESAARSRARKQAYVVELEREVDNLKAENELLKRQQRQILEAQSAQQLPKKHGLHRTSTAPF